MRRLTGRAPALVCALFAIYLGLNARDASLVRDANRAGAAGDFDAAVRTAQRVRHAPADARALVTVARAHTAAGRPDDADRAWAAAARRAPNDWKIQFEWARALGPHDPQQALRRYRRAQALNPSLPPPGR